MHDVIYDRIRISGDGRQSSFLLGRSPHKKSASLADWYRDVFARGAFLKNRSISRRFRQIARFLRRTMKETGDRMWECSTETEIRVYACVRMGVIVIRSEKIDASFSARDEMPI